MHIVYQLDQDDLRPPGDEMAEATTGPAGSDQDNRGGPWLSLGLLIIIAVLGFRAVAQELISLPLALAAAAVVLWVVSRRWRAIRGTPNRLEAVATGRHEATLSGGGLFAKSPRGERNIPWREVDSITSADAHTYVWVKSGPPLVIPAGKVLEGEYDTFVRSLYEEFVRVRSMGA